MVRYFATDGLVGLRLVVLSLLNSLPTFSTYLYNRVYSELTSRNSLSRSRLACSRLSEHIQPSVNNPDTDGAVTTTRFASTGDLPSVK